MYNAHPIRKVLQAIDDFPQTIRRDLQNDKFPSPQNAQSVPMNHQEIER